MDFDRGKFKALVLYVIWRAGEQRDFGSTKLNKALWFADARANEALGSPITGETYIREKFGPVPKHILDVLSELETEEQIVVWSEPFFDHKITRFQAFQPPSTDLFTREQMSLVDWWIRHVSEEHTAASISEKSHDYAWKIAKMGEVVPMHAFLASRIRAPDGEELNWAIEEAEKLGLK
ncbi:MAG: Panacea domain-containing protein [Hyphomicrobiaceae bacterium]